MKVAIARALVHDPDTILLDEPTNGLDIMSTRALREMLRKLRDAGQVPALLVARDAGSDGAVRPDRDPQSRPRGRPRHGAGAASRRPARRRWRTPSCACWEPARGWPHEARAERTRRSRASGGRRKETRRHVPRPPVDAGDLRHRGRRGTAVAAAGAEPRRQPARQGPGTDAARRGDRACARAGGVPRAAAGDDRDRARRLRAQDPRRRPRRRPRGRQGLRERRRRGPQRQAAAQLRPLARPRAQLHRAGGRRCCAPSPASGDRAGCCCAGSRPRS